MADSASVMECVRFIAALVGAERRWGLESIVGTVMNAAGSSTGGAPPQSKAVINHRTPHAGAAPHV